MKNILAIIVIVSCLHNTHAQTNALWFQTVVPPTNSLTRWQICDIIEAESAKLDPTGQGLKVIYLSEPRREEEAGIAFSPSPISFYQLLDVVASSYSFRASAKVFNTVGVIPFGQYRYVYTAIEGYCSDAQTGEPIANFNIDGGYLSPPLLAIQTNGYFVCGIQQRFDFSQSFNATFAEHNITDVKQDLTITAPGYTPLVITNEVYRPGDKCGLRTYDIKLTRSDETNEGEQAGPGYPPQGVGSPDP